MLNGNKADVAADLQKMFKVLSAHHKKAAAFHKAKASHHDGIAKAHSTLAGFVKGKHDAMEDGDANKAYFGKAAEHHEAKAAHHTSLSKAHADHADVHTATANSLEAQAPDGTKVANNNANLDTPVGVPSTGTSGGNDAGSTGAAASNKVAGAIESTVDALVQKALSEIDTNPAIQQTIQEAVLSRVQKALGEKVEDPPARVVPIARAAVTPTTPVDMRFAHLCTTNFDEE